MNTYSKKTNLLHFAFFFWMSFCLVIGAFAQTSRSQKSKSDDGHLLRAAIVNAETSLRAQESSFTYASRRVDLNGDGNDEVVIWIPNLNVGGTGGYPILIFSQTKSGYRKLQKINHAWSPIVALNSKQNGWRDIAFQNGGGGAEWQYFVYRHDGKNYKYSRTQKKQPEGEILIEKDWKPTILGPIPNQ